MRARPVSLLLLLAGCGASGAEPAPAPAAAPAVAEAVPAAEPAAAADLAPAPASAAPVPVASARDGDLEWSLRASATTISMAERDGWTLATVATNVGTAPVDFFQTGISSYRVNGLSSIVLELAFSNGLSPAAWAELAPGESAAPERSGFGDALFPTPGDYEIVMTHGAAVVGLTVHVVAAAGDAPPGPGGTPGPTAGAGARDGDLEWRLSASATTLSMAERDGFLLRTEATNVGTAPVDFFAAPPVSFTLDGVPSMELDMAFGNGGAPGSWRALSPGATAAPERGVGRVFTTPGEHTIEMRTGGGARTSLVVRVTP